MQKTNVYIDGFNFYYGCVRGTPYRWLDLGRFCHTVFPKNQIHRIRYFTALVKPTPQDPTQADRQLTDLRALGTIPHLSAHYGRFSVTTKRRWLANTPPGSPPRSVEVIQVEEKGSDVNLASHLLMDGFDRDYEVAVVVSNDSDLLEPIRLVRSRLGLKVGLLNPYRKTAVDLRGQADFYRVVRESALRACQFPTTLVDANGTIVKPAEW
jgi:uncharacterized LabA/DUF88 family protein